MRVELIRFYNIWTFIYMALIIIININQMLISAVNKRILNYYKKAKIPEIAVNFLNKIKFLEKNKVNNLFLINQIYLFLIQKQKIVS